jgi:aspartyl-tRNA(Asn)/glutamyl-tRNA(Gln) amidotransferase subunit A
LHSSDPTELTVGAASERLGRGEVSASGLAEAYLGRIAALDPIFHCYVAVRVEEARAEARAADARRARGERCGPLDGIPIALKDNIDVAGVPTTNGMGPRPDATPARDAEVVRRLRAAGAVILGKLNMHEGALGGSTDNPHHGPTHNPWRLGFTPGGSSGGTGAAVAARLCAAGLGTDTMGSVRLPAAYCGVAGLKPTFGLVSTRGVVPLSPRLDTVGPLARCVTDLGLMLDAMAGFDPDHVESVRAPEGSSYAVAARGDLAGLRLGLIENLERAEMDPDVRRVFGEAVELLERLGGKLRRLELPGYEPTPARRAGLLLCEAEAAVVHERDMAASPGAFSPAFRQMLEFGRDAPAARLVKAERRIQVAGLLLRRALTEVDLVIAPTAPQPAFAFSATPPVGQADLTAIASFAGCPAVSVPCGLGRAGLPVGLQLIGPPFGERALLAAARVFEAACGFALAPPAAGSPEAR